MGYTVYEVWINGEYKCCFTEYSIAVSYAYTMGGTVVKNTRDE